MTCVWQTVLVSEVAGFLSEASTIMKNPCIDYCPWIIVGKPLPHHSPHSPTLTNPPLYLSDKSTQWSLSAPSFLLPRSPISVTYVVQPTHYWQASPYGSAWFGGSRGSVGFSGCFDTADIVGYGSCAGVSEMHTRQGNSEWLESLLDDSFYCWLKCGQLRSSAF